MVGVRHRNDCVSCAEAFGDIPRLVKLADDRSVVYTRSHLADVIIQQGDDVPRFRFCKLADQTGARSTSSQHQHRFTFGGCKTVEPMLLPASVSEPRASHQHHQKEWLEEQHGAWPDE